MGALPARWTISNTEFLTGSASEELLYSILVNLYSPASLLAYSRQGRAVFNGRSNNKPFLEIAVRGTA